MAEQLLLRKRVLLFYVTHMRGVLSSNIVREVCTYIPDYVLVQVTDKYLRFFDFQTLTWGPQVQVHSQVVANIASSLVVLEDQHWLCCGGTGHTGTNGLGTKAHIVSQNRGTGLTD